MPAKIEDRGNGQYRLCVAQGYDSNGKQLYMRKTIQAKSRKEAEKQYNLYFAEVMQGKVLYSGTIKLKDFAEEWIKDFVEKQLAPKTQNSYRNHLNYRILPALGHLEIQSIRPDHINKFNNMLANGGKRFDGREGKISDKSLMYCFRVLSSMLKYAVLTQKINDNPCDKAIPPKVARHKSICFDDANLARMFVALNKEPIKYRAIVLTGIYTGCRLGELLGLKWSDINYDKATISITRSVQALHGRGMYAKAPKTENSIREFAASPNVMSILSEYKEWQEGQKAKAGEQWQEGGWIFTRKNGKPVFPTTPSHWFREFLKRHNLPPMRFHDLRHLSATLMIAQGVPMKNVSDRLGHADVRTTLNIYASSMKSVDRQAAESIDKFVDSITANP